MPTSTPHNKDVLNRQRYQKPLPGCRLDDSHPLAANLAHVSLFNEGAGSTTNELLSGLTTKKSSTLKWGAGNFLTGCLTGGSFNNSNISNYAIHAGLGPLTIEAFVYAGSGSVTGGWAGGFNAFNFVASSSSIYFSIIDDGSNGSNTTSITVPGAGWYHVVASYSGVAGGNQLGIYVNGIYYSRSFSGVAPTTTFTLTFASLYASVGTNSKLEYLRLWSGRALSQDDARSLYLSPFEMFLPGGVKRNALFINKFTYIPSGGGVLGSSYATLSLSGPLFNANAFNLHKARTKPPLGSPLNYSNQLVSSCIEFWPFQEGGGNLSTSLVNQTAISFTSPTTAWTGSSGPFSGPSVSFNGSSYATASDKLLVSGTNNLSVSCWVKTTYTGTTAEFLFGYGTNSGGSFFEVGVYSGGYIYMNAGTTGSVVDGTGFSYGFVADGKWHHIACTRSGNLFTLYVDGNNVGGGTRLNASIALNGTCYFGAGTAGTSPLACSLDLFAVFSRCLSQPEIQELYFDALELLRQPLHELLAISPNFIRTIAGGAALGTKLNPPTTQGIIGATLIQKLPEYQKPLPGVEVLRSHPIAANLDRLYLFNEGAGIASYCATGQNDPVIFPNNTNFKWGTGGFGGPALFNNAAGVHATTKYTPSWTTNFTLLFWVKSATTNASALNRILGWGDGSVGTYGISPVWGYSNGLYFAIRQGANNGTTDLNLTPPSGYLTGWHQVVLTVSSNPNVGASVYFDGKYLGGNTATTQALFSTYTLVVGGYISSDGFNGSIDHIATWSRILSPDDIKLLFARPFCFCTQERFLTLGTSTITFPQQSSGGAASGSSATSSATMTPVIAGGGAAGASTRATLLPLTMASNRDIITRYRYQKPPPGCELDLSHPLAGNLSRAYLFNEGAGFSANDVVSGVSLAGNANTAWTSGKFGGYCLGPGFNSFTGVGPGADATGGGAITLEALFYANSVGTNFTTFSTGWCLGSFQRFYIQNNGGIFGAAYDDNDNGFTTSGASFTAPGWLHVVLSYTGLLRNTYNLYVNGYLAKSGAAGITTNITLSRTAFGASNNSGCVNQVEYIRSWFGRALSLDEVRELYLAPFEMFLPGGLKRSIFIGGMLSFYGSSAGGGVGGSSTQGLLAYTQTPSGGGVGGSSTAGNLSFSPTPAGGPAGGSTAGLSATMTPVVAGGAAGGSTASNNFTTTYTASGGGVGGSSDTLSATMSPVVSGGPAGGSTATTNFTTTYTASGGGVGGASATTSFAFTETPAGGAVGGSSTTPSFANTYNASGGAAGGSAATTNFTTTYTASGGGVGGSSSVASFATTYSPSGGGAGGSTATTNFTTTYSPSGGGVGGSSSVASFTSNYTASGGAAGGSTATTNFTTTYTTSGGGVGGASSAINFTTTYSPSGGGAGGAASSPSLTTTYSPSGGVAGGTSTSPAFAVTETPSGGAAGGSSSTTTATFTPAPAGGAVGGSTADFGNNFDITASGGPAGGSSGTLSAAFSPVPAGGAAGGSSATTNFTTTYTASGGGVGGSSASTNFTTTYTVAGGGVGGSSAAVNPAFTPTPAGGAAGGSSATPTSTAVFNETASGGVVGGSSSTPTTSSNFNPTASGGAVGGASAAASLGNTVVVAGGAAGGARLIALPGFAPTVAGGAAGGASSNPSATMAPVISGGPAGGASSLATPVYTKVPGGGAVGGGTALPFLQQPAIAAPLPVVIVPLVPAVSAKAKVRPTTLPTVLYPVEPSTSATGKATALPSNAEGALVVYPNSSTVFAYLLDVEGIFSDSIWPHDFNDIF